MSSTSLNNNRNGTVNYGSTLNASEPSESVTSTVQAESAHSLANLIMTLVIVLVGVLIYTIYLIATEVELTKKGVEEEKFFGEINFASTQVEPINQGDKKTCWAHAFVTVAVTRVKACQFEGSREALFNAILTDATEAGGGRPNDTHFQAVDKACSADSDSPLCICLRSLDIKHVSNNQPVKNLLPKCSKLVTKDRSQTTFLSERVNQRPLWVAVKQQDWHLSLDPNSRHAMVAECVTDDDHIRIVNSWGASIRKETLLPDDYDKDFPTHDEFGRFYVHKDRLTDCYNILDVVPREELLSFPAKQEEYWFELMKLAQDEGKGSNRQRDYLTRALEMNPENFEGWMSLLNNIRRRPVSINGIEYSRQELMREAFKLDPVQFRTAILGTDLAEEDEKMQIWLQETFTLDPFQFRRAVLEKEIERDDKNVQLWEELAQFGGGLREQYSKEKCEQKVAALVAELEKVKCALEKEIEKDDKNVQLWKELAEFGGGLRAQYSKEKCEQKVAQLEKVKCARGLLKLKNNS